MTSETQIHTIARQMIERRGYEAIAEAARIAQACESKGGAEEAREWPHIADAMKLMRGTASKLTGHGLVYAITTLTSAARSVLHGSGTAI